MNVEHGYKSTDVEIWRQELFDHSDPDNAYSPSIHIADAGNVTIKAGGHAIQMHVTEWVAMALRDQRDEHGPFDEPYAGPVDGPPQWWRKVWHRIKLQCGR